MERDVSYGELRELNLLFAKQIEHVEFMDEGTKEEAHFDFVQQYINGNDNPRVQLLYPDRQRYIR